jgi:FkbM family methyltransferase
MSTSFKPKEVARALPVQVPRSSVPVAFAMNADSLPARVICAPSIQLFYARVREIPILGELLHKLVLRVLPASTRVTTLVRKGLGSGLLLSLNPRFEAQYATGLYEVAMLKCLAAHLKQGDVLYDVGGHIGFVSLVGAQLVGLEGRVFAFEADPENASRIGDHAHMNALPQVEVVPAAVWSECKTLSFHRAPASSSRNTGAITGEAENVNVERMIVVEAVTLDRFALDHRPPAVIKIDVEGAEEEVLKGAETVFLTRKPLLICEIHHARSAEAVMNWLESVGYSWTWQVAESQFPRHLVAQANT